MLKIKYGNLINISHISMQKNKYYMTNDKQPDNRDSDFFTYYTYIVTNICILDLRFKNSIVKRKFSVETKKI